MKGEKNDVESQVKRPQFFLIESFIAGSIDPLSRLPEVTQQIWSNLQSMSITLKKTEDLSPAGCLNYRTNFDTL